MTTLTAADILKAALALPTPDRERIARELWDSVPPPGVLSEDDPGFAEELGRRSEAMRSGDDPGVDAFEAIKRLRARSGQRAGS